jgi:hypothetical protein
VLAIGGAASSFGLCFLGERVLVVELVSLSLLLSLLLVVREGGEAEGRGRGSGGSVERGGGCLVLWPLNV